MGVQGKEERREGGEFYRDWELGVCWLIVDVSDLWGPWFVLVQVKFEESVMSIVFSLSLLFISGNMSNVLFFEQLPHSFFSKLTISSVILFI